MRTHTEDNAIFNYYTIAHTTENTMFKHLKPNLDPKSVQNLFTYLMIDNNAKVNKTFQSILEIHFSLQLFEPEKYFY